MVAGVAMGMLLDETGGGGEPIILTDILGSEDALGTMDFKVAGDEQGVTAFQLDIKCEGLSIELMRTALEQARQGRLHILGRMKEAMPEPAAELPDGVHVELDPCELSDESDEMSSAESLPFAYTRMYSLTVASFTISTD